MGGYHQDFFPAGPPTQCAEPLDSKLCERIKKLAEFAARNGTYSHLILVSLVVSNLILARASVCRACIHRRGSHKTKGEPRLQFSMPR